MFASATVLQIGLPEFIPDLVAIGGTIVLVLMILAFGAFVYKSLTGGVEWPEDREEEDSDSLTQGSDDDEWDYY